MNIKQQQQDRENRHCNVMIVWCDNVNYNFQLPATASSAFVALSFYLFIHLDAVGY